MRDETLSAERAQEGIETIDVGVELGRELEEHGAERGSQVAHTLEE